MTGSALKQLGLYRVESHNQALVGLARSVAKEICGRVGQVTIDQVRDHPAMAGIEPSSPNFWGCLFLEKGWHCIDRQHSVRRTNHAREIKVWRYEGA